jgi:hypothetical protein
VVPHETGREAEIEKAERGPEPISRLLPQVQRLADLHLTAGLALSARGHTEEIQRPGHAGPISTLAPLR